jgi:hypothetical protein
MPSATSTENEWWQASRPVAVPDFPHNVVQQGLRRMDVFLFC